MWNYDKKHRRIYAVDELYKVKTLNGKLAEWLKAKGYDNCPIIADSSEPKSIAELKSLGINRIKGAVKGKDSVEFGERWLDELDEIIIDPLRTPNIAKEFENIDYATDRNGDPLPRLEDKDNHAIDATRYAFNNDMNRRGSGMLFAKGGL